MDSGKYLTQKAVMAVSFSLALSISSTASAQQGITVGSVLDESSIELDYFDETVSYQLVDNWGGSHDVEFDLANEQWMVTTADGDVLAGSISAAAMNEYYAQGSILPCFSNPWAFAGCGAAAIVGALICEVRASTNLRRARNSCTSQGLGFSFQGISGCGTVSGYCFQPNHHLQEP